MMRICRAGRCMAAVLAASTLVMLAGCGIAPVYAKSEESVSLPESAAEPETMGQTPMPVNTAEAVPAPVETAADQLVSTAEVQAPEETKTPQETVSAATPPARENSDIPSETQPPTLERMVNSAGLEFSKFEFSQLVLVAADGSEATVYCYDKTATGLWVVNKETSYIDAYVGRNGVSAQKTEGDDFTPSGIYSLGYAFGNNPRPETGMEYHSITRDSYWVDDPDSDYYNQWVEGVAANWNSAEHLSDAVKSYAYAILVEYNTLPNVVKGAGSAIFIHCGSKPTSGCITVAEGSLLKILDWLSQEKMPHILICGQ